jgi:hypothetical protein
MIRARPARVLESVAQGTTGPMEPDRGIVGRNSEVVSHPVKRFAPQLYSLDQHGVFRFQSRDHIVEAGADGP